MVSRIRSRVANILSILVSLNGISLSIIDVAHAMPASPTTDGSGIGIGAAVPPMAATVETRLLPQMEGLIDRLLRQRRAMTIDDVPVFESGDAFLPGKIAAAMAYRVLDLKPDDPRLPQRLADFSLIADLTIADTNKTWGIYYYVSALGSLQRAGLLERAVRPETLARLRRQLDWRSFVRDDLTLIDLPNNYYGVAFSIARLRFLLGWDDAKASEALLVRTIDHYRLYSGTYGFADETDGKGRFDRYSILLIGEIAQRLIETGMEAPPEVKVWLRRSVDLMLPRFNMTGEGWEYGRSIGAYGETAFLELLTAAARLKVLTPTEERMAYAFSSRIAARYMNFWIDPRTGSVNLWDGGRRTDAYRGKHRIFGENLSLSRQLIYTNRIWSDLGYGWKAPAADYAHWLEALPRSTMTWFSREGFDRGVLTIRDGDRVIGLPLINGADGQHMHNPYFPIPFSPGMLQGAADSDYPLLLPRLTLSNGHVLMPLAWFKDVKIVRRGAVTEISWRQEALDRMGGDDAVQDTSVSIRTRYSFEPERIVRTDTVSAHGDARISSVGMEFANFSKGPSPIASGRVSYGGGGVRQFDARGYGACSANVIDRQPYRSSTGAFHSLVRCEATWPKPRRVLHLAWALSYSSMRK